MLDVGCWILKQNMILVYRDDELWSQNLENKKLNGQQSSLKPVFLL